MPEKIVKKKTVAEDTVSTKALLGQVSALTAAVESLSKPRSASGLTPDQVFATPIDHAEERRLGFKSFADYCTSVRNAGIPNGTRDKRLFTKAVSGMSEGSAADGGFLIPPEFSSKIFQRVYENDLLSRTDKYTCSGNTMVFPAIDETSRADGSRFGGVRGYWLDEAGQLTSSKPKFRRISMTLHKLACLAYITEELLNDASVGLDQYLTKLFAMEMEFLVGNALFRGDGVGKPLGVFNCPAKITVSKETGQAASTFIFENVLRMWARMWGPSKKNAVWYINTDVTRVLPAMSLGIGTAGVATYMPPGGLSDAPYGTLLGRPIVETEFNSTLGTVGDVLLADMSQYLTLSKGAADSQSSMHLRFDYDEMAYRVILRIDGQPWWNSALTPFQGSNTLSPFVLLETRS